MALKGRSGTRNHHYCVEMRPLESLDVWNLSNELARRAYRLTIKSELERHFSLSDQIRRAASSVPANLAEGYALGTKAQLIRHIRISYGSAAELKTHIKLARDVGIVDRDSVADIIDDTDRVICMLVGWLKRLGARPP